MTVGDLAPEVELDGAGPIGEFLTQVFEPSVFTVVATGGEPHAIVVPTRLRSLRVAMIRVDRPLTLTIEAGRGPVLAVPLGYGLAPEAITRPATLTARRRSPVTAVDTTTVRPFAATEVVALLSLSQADLELEAGLILGHPPTRAITFDLTVDLTAPTGRRLEAAVEVLWNQTRAHSPLLASDLAERRIEQLVLDMFLLAADHIEEELVGEDGDSILTPWVRHAVELLETDPGIRWSVTTLSHAVAVSPRALHHGFRRDLGTTPMSYLLELRLARAHAEFSRRPAGTTVAEVANQLGLPHPGRFASAYRTRFGEMPSETLRR